MENIAETAKRILNRSKSLVIYRELRKLKIWRFMEGLLKGITEEEFSPAQWIEDYYEFLHLLFCESLISEEPQYTLSWKGWVVDKVIHSENPFSLMCERCGDNFREEIGQVVEHDLSCIRDIANIPWTEWAMFVMRKGKIHNAFNPWGLQDQIEFDQFIQQNGLKDWGSISIGRHYKRHGAGVFSRYQGFCWNGSALEGIQNPDPITLDQLVGYDTQKKILMNNTDKFINGYPANNVLLYGDKGTGKSSMVKALLHQYGKYGLKVIELPKVHLGDYHKVIDKLENRGFKSILFIDDLSFEEHETEYKHIKALLEGGLKARPYNVLVYATSNRRHLIREMSSDRSSAGFHYNEQNEISPTDSMQEKLSLADRFGITLTFTAPNQRGYLEMVQAIAHKRGLHIRDEELRDRALQWEKRFNGRSGRTARQFVDDLEGRLSDS